MVVKYPFHENFLIVKNKIRNSGLFCIDPIALFDIDKETKNMNLNNARTNIPSKILKQKAEVITTAQKNEVFH